MKKQQTARVLLSSLSLLMAFILTACGNRNLSDPNTTSSYAAQASSVAEPQTIEETPQATEEYATPESISEEPLSSGVICIDGDIIRLGASYSQIHAGKWSLSDADYEKYQSYTLNPRTTARTGMILYSDEYGHNSDGFHVMISVMNPSEYSIPYLEGAIDFLSITSIAQAAYVPEILLPGGLTLNSTKNDFIAVYGRPSREQEDTSAGFQSLSFKDGDVELILSWNKNHLNELTLTRRSYI